MEIRTGCLILTAALALSAAGCGGSSKGESTMPGGMGASNQANLPKVDPSLCDTDGKRVETFDLNQDNNPDVWKLYAQVEEDGTNVDVLTCKQVDYDHDGDKDYVATYDRTGALVSESFDFTFDGKFDATRYYDKKTGQVYMVQRDIDHNQKPDTWEKYDTQGQLESIERDRNGDSKPDLWEQYQKGDLLAILYDEDFDGKVDRKQSSRPTPEAPATPAPPSGSSTDQGATGADQGAAPASNTTPPADETPAAPAAKPAKPAKPAK